MREVFKVRQLADGKAVIDVLGDGGDYERDPLCHPTSLRYANNRVKELNDWVKNGCKPSG